MNYIGRVALTLGLLTPSLLADGMILFPRPYPLPLSIKYHKVVVNIENGVARTAVDQVFVNRTNDELVGGRYVFPVPPGAVISDFTVEVDGVMKSATLMDNEEAENFFNNAVKQSNQAALLAYTRNQAYMLQLTSMAPGARKRIKLSYAEVLKKTGDLSAYHYPLNTEKFSFSLIDTVTIDVSIANTNPITSVYSPSHAISLERADKHRVKAHYASYRSRPNQDFKLYYKLSNSEISFHLFPYIKTGEDGYFLMLITPRYLEPAEQQGIIAKDIVFTIDKSGSMKGVKITQARDALTFCLNRLNTGDNFNIISFNHAHTSNAPTLLPANAANLQQARAFVTTIKQGGSTNIGSALVNSLLRIKPSELPHYIIFLTDGLPTAGVRDRNGIADMVQRANSHKTRIFSIGFGHDVNTILLDQVSDNSGGFALFCDPKENIESVVGQLYRMIENPILTSPQIAVQGVVFYDILPVVIPDLFAGNEIAIFGRYKGQGPATVTLSGDAGGLPKSFSYQTVFPGAEADYDFVPRLWATQKIAQLMADIKNSTFTREQENELVDSIKTISLSYGIITPYTSMLFTAPKDGNERVWRALKDSVGGRANRMSNYQNAMQQNSNRSQSMARDYNEHSMYMAPRNNQMQNIGNKVFVYSLDSLWTDAAADSSQAYDTLYFGSDEYFAMAASNPELQQYMTVGSQAIINYQGKNHLILNGPGPSVANKPAPSETDGILQGRFEAVPDARGIRIILPKRTLPASVQIYSARGVLVRRLEADAAASELVWDARGPSGKPVAGGLYAARLRVGKAVLVQRFVYLR